MRTPHYERIAAELRSQLGAGDLPAGQLLPSEAELSAAYAVSRVTIRKALEVLREEGLVSSRQGVGWFAATSTVRQSLGRLGTLEAQLESEGLPSERRIIEFAFVEARQRAREVFGPGEVLKVRRVNLAGRVPFAVVTVWCPRRYGDGLSRADVEGSPFSDLIGLELGGAVQTIGAGAASATDAGLLGVPEGSPVLLCERVTHDTAGESVLLSRFVFPGHLTEFVVELSRSERSIAPSGLRLLESGAEKER